MKVVYNSTFLREVKNLHGPIKTEVAELLIFAESHTWGEFSTHYQIKKLQGWKNFFRIRIRDYRLGFAFEENTTLRFMRVGQRKDIYKRFP